MHGERVALGGTKLLVFNEEVRFPLFWLLSGAAFADAGNTFTDEEGIVLGDLAVGVGFGLRIRTPLAPVRLDLGFPVSSRYWPDGRPLAFLDRANLLAGADRCGQVRTGAGRCGQVRRCDRCAGATVAVRRVRQVRWDECSRGGTKVAFHRARVPMTACFGRSEARQVLGADTWRSPANTRGI